MTDWYNNMTSDSTKGILTILKSFDIEPRPLDHIVSDYFAKHREIHSRDRRLVADAVFDIMRYKRRIDFVLKTYGQKNIDGQKRIEAYRCWMEDDKSRLSIPKDAFEDREGVFHGKTVDYLSFPDFIYKDICKEYGSKRAFDILDSLNKSAPPTLRVNIKNTNRQDAIDALERDNINAVPTKYSPYGIVIDKRINLESKDIFKKGFVEFQDEASQICSILSYDKGSGFVLDACAGAGGKTLAIGMLCSDDVRIFATDIDSSKLSILRKRVRRAGLKNVEAIPSGSLENIKKFKGKFDTVIIDAPCSGTGTMRRAPDIRWRLSPSDIDDYVDKQNSLIREYSNWVKVGGRLIYITCSILSSENRKLVDNLLKSEKFRPEAIEKRIENAGLKFDKDLNNKAYLSFLPDVHSWDGFFIASLIRHQ